MTKRERAQVVELLRCAADGRVDGIGVNGMFDAQDSARIAQRTFGEAWDLVFRMRAEQAKRDRANVMVGTIDENYRCDLLEAAARVEEGRWP